MEKIIPDLQAAILCEDVRNEMAGQQSLVGVIPAIIAPAVPIGFFKLCLWSRWCGGSGNFVQKAVLLNAEDEKPLVSAEVKFVLNNLESHATNLHVFGGVQFPSFGLYHIEIYLDNELKLRFSVPVLQAQNPPGKPPFPPQQGK